MGIRISLCRWNANERECTIEFHYAGSVDKWKAEFTDRGKWVSVKVTTDRWAGIGALAAAHDLLAALRLAKTATFDAEVDRATQSNTHVCLHLRYYTVAKIIERGKKMQERGQITLKMPCVSLPEEPTWLGATEFLAPKPPLWFKEEYPGEWLDCQKDAIGYATGGVVCINSIIQAQKACEQQADSWVKFKKASDQEEKTMAFHYERLMNGKRWDTGDGRTLAPHQMDSSHVVNVLVYLEKWAYKYKNDFDGKLANDMAPRATTSLQDAAAYFMGTVPAAPVALWKMDAHQWIRETPIYKALIEEMEKRGLTELFNATIMRTKAAERW